MPACIMITTTGCIKYIDNIDDAVLFKNREMYSPFYKGYRLSISVKLFTKNSDFTDRGLNRKAMKIFNMGEIRGNIYVLLETNESEDESEDINFATNDVYHRLLIDLVDEKEL